MKFLKSIVLAALANSAWAAPAAEEQLSSSIEKRKSKFQFTGINQSGAEFGNKAIPGQLGKDYTWPVRSTIDVRLYLIPEFNLHANVLFRQ